MGLFFYTKKGSIISTVDLPTTEIIEPKKISQMANFFMFDTTIDKRSVIRVDVNPSACES